MQHQIPFAASVTASKLNRQDGPCTRLPLDAEKARLLAPWLRISNVGLRIPGAHSLFLSLAEHTFVRQEQRSNPFFRHHCRDRIKILLQKLHLFLVPAAHRAGIAAFHVQPRTILAAMQRAVRVCIKPWHRRLLFYKPHAVAKPCGRRKVLLPFFAWQKQSAIARARFIG